MAEKSEVASLNGVAWDYKNVEVILMCQQNILLFHD